MRSPSFVDLGSEKGDEYEDHSIRREDMDGSVQNLATEEFDAQSTLPRYNFYSQSNRSDHNSTVFSKKDRSYLEKTLLDDSFANSRIGLFLPPIRKGQPNDGLSLKKLNVSFSVTSSTKHLLELKQQAQRGPSEDPSPERVFFGRGQKAQLIETFDEGKPSNSLVGRKPIHKVSHGTGFEARYPCRFPER